jgi:tetrahydromethanopterin S-methyltransferase subunit E
MSQARTGILKRLYRQIANLCCAPLALIVWFVVNAILVVSYLESQLGGPLGALVGLIIGVKQQIVKNRKTFMLFRNRYGRLHLFMLT